LAKRVHVRRAAGIALFLVAGFVIVAGISVMVSDPYDSGRTGNVLFGLLWAMLGVVLGFGAWLLVRGRNR
jgi:hypothetical protein